MSAGETEAWLTQLRKGVLELCVLNALRGGAQYGYDILRGLREVEGLVVREGSVYSVLSRLKADGLLSAELRESSSGPPRRYFSLTASGRRRVRAMNEHWRTLAQGIDGYVRLDP